jgi:hypothetical protein
MQGLRRLGKDPDIDATVPFPTPLSIVAIPGADC